MILIFDLIDHAICSRGEKVKEPYVSLSFGERPLVEKRRHNPPIRTSHKVIHSPGALPGRGLHYC